jgi:hypothetical protein
MAKSFEDKVTETVKAIRELIAMDDKAPAYFHFSVIAEGRVRDGEVHIQFKLGETDYTNLTEYLRRIGWQKAHQYLALPVVESESMDS